jgi:hypothetical protein
MCFLEYAFQTYVELDNRYKIYWWVGNNNDFHKRINVGLFKVKPTIIRRYVVKSVDYKIRKLISHAISEIITLMLRTRVIKS